MRKHAATLVLVVCAVALGVWLWLDRDRVTEGERERRENSAFVAWRRDELSQITIAHEGETLILRRDPQADKSLTQGKNGAWRMSSPREERADPVAVERLVSTLELAAVVRRATESAELGFGAPRATGSVRMGNLDVPFVLGAVSPRPEGSSYFRVGGEPPIVVSKEIAEALLAFSDVYRDRTVVPYLATELSRFEARRPDGGFTLERLDERSFRVAQTGVLASRVAVDRVWAALAESRAEAFPKDADVERLTSHPVVTLVLTPIDGAQPPAELVIGSACPDHPADVVVLRKAPSRVAACAPKDILAALVVDAASLGERHVFSARMDEIEELRLARSGAGADAGAGALTALELARKGTGFHQRAPEDRDLTSAEAEAATELLTRIASSEALAVSRGDVSGIGPPFVAVARATVRSGDRDESVDIGPVGEAGRTTLRRVLDDARLEVDAAVVRRLLPRATSVRPRDVVDGEKRRTTRVLLRCGLEQELVDRGEGLRLLRPAGYETDGAIVQLVDGILHGKADTWVADADDGQFGFRPDGCHVVIGYEGDDGATAPSTIWFGDEGEGGVYARVESRTGVMVVPKALRELAGRIYVSRGALRVDSARVERIRVTSAGKEVPAGDGSAFASSLAGLSADRVVSLSREAGAPDLVIDVFVRDGGAPRRIACRAVSPAERHCSIDGVIATFAVAEARFGQLRPSHDEASDASPGGGAPDASKP